MKPPGITPGFLYDGKTLYFNWYDKESSNGMYLCCSIYPDNTVSTFRASKSSIRLKKDVVRIPLEDFWTLTPEWLKYEYLKLKLKEI